MSGTKLRNYCWTYFAEELEIEENEDIKYCVFQKEKCPKTGKIHFQGYVELTKPMRRKATQEALGIEGAHLEKRRGTREEARDYCMKEETRVDGPWEIGEFGKGQGARNDLSKLKEVALSRPIGEVVLGEHVKNFQHLRFAEGLQKYRKGYHGVKLVFWYYGGTGTGKSKRADDEAGRDATIDYARISYHNGFWNGYNGEERVVIDDIRSNVPLNELLRLTDRYSETINVKGTCLPWMAREIYITCDRAPSELYRAEREGGQLSRRYTEIINFDLGRDSGTKSVGNTITTDINEVTKDGQELGGNGADELRRLLTN